MHQNLQNSGKPKHPGVRLCIMIVTVLANDTVHTYSNDIGQDKKKTRQVEEIEISNTRLDQNKLTFSNCAKMKMSFFL